MSESGPIRGGIHGGSGGDDERWCRARNLGEGNNDGILVELWDFGDFGELGTESGSKVLRTGGLSIFLGLK
jgi:hypothetical protein